MYIIKKDKAMAVVMEYIVPLLLLDKPEAAEELYIKHYSILGFEINHPEMWASDTFRSIDPVYIHNYVVGAVLGEKLIKYLQGEYFDDYINWGSWLYGNMYKHGRGRLFREMIMGVEELI